MARPRTGRPAFQDGRWIARILLRDGGRALVVLTRDGKQLTAKAKDEAWARQLAARYQQRYDEGTWAPESKPRAPVGTPAVSQWVDDWLMGQSYREREHDRARCRKWLGRLGKLPLSEVSPKAVAAWLDWLRSKPLAPRTQRNIMAPVQRALRRAVFDGHLAADPFGPVPSEMKPSAEDKDPLARASYRFERAQLETLLREPTVSERWRAVWWLLALTGTRASEMAALRWCDLRDDAPLRRIVVARQVHRETREVLSTKTNAIRYVPEHPQLRAVLEHWREYGWPAEYGRKPSGGDLIVPCRGEAGRPWGAADGSGGALWIQDVLRALHRDLEACCLPRHRTHDFRHTFASLCADAGMSAEVASRWTHAPAGQSARHLYVAPSWARQCEEMLKLRLDVPAPT